MKSFRQLREQLLQLDEVLEPEEKKEVDGWEKGDNSFSDHVFSDDKNRSSHELVHPTNSEHAEIVKKHIEPHGFKIKDYRKGTAEDKHGRETSLGKALNRVKAPEDVKRKFENDPQRAQKLASNLHVSLSRHHHDVAGMTSKGHSWEQESCMNFKSGKYNQYLKGDVKHGTHVAYLTDKDDKHNERPLARIALKKFTNVDDPEDHILRPENRTYGNAPDAFEHTVNKIVNKHFPGKEDGIYKKHGDVYDDTENNIVIGHKAIDKAITHSDPEVRALVPKHKDLKPHHIDKILNQDSESDDHGSFVVDKMKLDVLKHHNVSKENLETAFKSKNASIRARVFGDSRSSHLIDKGLDDPSPLVRGKALQHPGVSDKHIERAIKENKYGTVKDAVDHPKATEDQIHRVLDHPDKDVRLAAVSARNATLKNLQKAEKDQYHFVSNIAKNRIAEKDHK